MTFQTTDQSTATDHIKRFRPVIGFVFLGVVGVELLLGLLDWLLPLRSSESFSVRSMEGFFNFSTSIMLALPVLAVLINTVVAPVPRAAKIITLVALVEYAVLIVAGLGSTLLGLVALLDRDGWVLVTGIAYRVTMLALAGVALFVVLQSYLGAYPKPTPAAAYPAGYPSQQYPGHPPYGYPQAQPVTQYAQQAAVQQAVAQQTQYAPQAGHGHYQAGQAQTGQYQVASPAPTSGAAASTAPVSGQPQPAAQPYGTGQPAQQPQPPHQAAAWPPPPSGSPPPWPPTPGSGSAARADTPDAQPTQALRPEQYRGNAPG